MVDVGKYITYMDAMANSSTCSTRSDSNEWDTDIFGDQCPKGLLQYVPLIFEYLGVVLNITSLHFFDTWCGFKTSLLKVLHILKRLGLRNT